MVLRNNPPANKPARLSRRRLAVVSVTFLLTALGTAGDAFAAVDCGAGTALNAAATQCLGHHPRAGAHERPRTRKTAKATAGRVADGEALTPADPATAEPASPGFRLPDLSLPASDLVHRLALVGRGPSPFSGRGAPEGNRWPASPEAPKSTRVTAGAPAPRESATSLRDMVHGGGMPAVPAPLAWAILLLGILGLRLLTRPPRVDRVQSWAATSPSRAAWSLARAKASRSALDRVDPERYARAEVRRQGHFVRGPGANRFGADR
jgi:hypothetical protein